ncbi:ABC transporter ATP-binding protein [Actinospica durhamensis]|uniref:ABC transporter ATP-binding protein n=1 Tax=Actinospica durhamensis TaxID=1508375 RepID=A0A941EJB8_9ACTN|nr:ABC transporter ATP-binding protein [Actinospica durhamensis]MBR7832441.1 ABC transporter ATP-binding protein [Actinospica durhamensis]
MSTGAEVVGAAAPVAAGVTPVATGVAGGVKAGVAAQADGSVPAIATSGLSKRFRGGQLAVDTLDLAVPQGAVFGFLGPNGSGKTTTIRMLLGLITPTAGGCRLFGETVDASRVSTLTRVGALIEGPAHYPYLTGRANLARYDAADRTADPATRARRIDRALEQVGLGSAAEKKAKNYSLGMKQRLGLACALLQPRDLLILDEPTNGLDPQGMREIRSLITSLAAQGTTVFLSSHLLDEIEQVCTDVAIMSRGRLVSQGSVTQLRAGQRARLTVTTPDPADAARVLAEQGGTDVQVAGHRVDCDAREDLAPDVVCAALVASGVRVLAFGVERPSLEDAFVALTGEGFDVAG